MANNYYTSYSISNSQFLNTSTPQLLSSDLLTKNPLRASEIVATSSESSNVIQLPLEQLQIKFVLFAAEVDRLQILNSLTNKELEHWRKKFLENEKLLALKGGKSLQSDQKVLDLETKVELLNRNIRVLNETIESKDREIEDLRKRSASAVSNGNKDQEIEFWKKKANQSEAEFFDKVQTMKIQTETVLRDKIEGEVRSALQHFEQEKVFLQQRINDLAAENEQLSSRSRANNSEGEIAFWRDKYNNLENTFENKIRASIETKLHETLTPIVRENESLLKQLQFYKEKYEESEARLTDTDEKTYVYSTVGRNTEVEKRSAAPQNEEKLKLYYMEQVKTYENRIILLEADKQGLVNQLRELENRVQGLMKDNNLLSDHLREISEKEHQLYDANRTKDNLQGTVQAQSREIETWKEKYRTLERDLQKRSQDFAGEKVEYEKALEIVGQKLTEFEQLMEAAENENNGLKAQLSQVERERNSRHDAQHEVEMWREKYQALEQETQAYIDKTLNEVEVHFRERVELEKKEHSAKILQEKNQLEQRLRELESKSSSVGGENQELLVMNNNISQELQRLKIQHERLVVENREMKMTLENERRNFIEKEIGGLQGKLQGTQQENERLKEVIKGFETKQIMLFIEIERLYLVNGEFIQELNRITDEINYLINENEELTQRLTEMNNAVENIKYDKIKCEELIVELKNQLEDSDKRIQLLITENARLSDSAIVRLKEIENLKGAVSSKTVTQYESPKKSELEIQEIGLQHEREKHRMEAQIYQLNQALEVNKNELRKYQDINNRRKQENEELIQELDNTKTVLWNLQNRESESNFNKDKFEQSMKEVEEMRKARDFYRQQYEQASGKLKGYYNEKIKETVPNNYNSIK